MNGLKTIISKELRRVFTDRKLIFSMFILPAIVVIGVMYLTSTLMNNMQDKVKEHVSEIVVYQAPEDFVQIAEGTEGISVKYILAHLLKLIYLSLIGSGVRNATLGRVG